MINACVSHELRNPLNSLIAQGLNQLRLYEVLTAEIAAVQDEAQRVRMEAALGELRESTKIQDASGNLMLFLVQDLLDFAQIKSGKFRKNVSSFDITETVQHVMEIQMSKARERGIVLRADFTEVAQRTIKSDEKRIM